MSLLSICQGVARVTPVEIPTVIVGSTNETASLLLACAQDEGEALSRRTDWVTQTKEHTFTTTSGVADYALPSDYRWLVGDTVWDRANYWDMRGPLSPQQWQAHKSSILANTATTWKRYRIRSVSGTVMFSIHPTPDTSSETLVYEYGSKNWCKSSGGTGQTSWMADTDEGILDEYLIRLGVKWRFLKRLGLAYEEERLEYEDQVERAIAKDGGAPVLDLSKRPVLHLLGSQNVPETGYGS